MQRFQMLGCDSNKNFLLEGALPNKCEVLSSNLRSKEQCRSLFSTIAHLESCGTLEGLPKGIGRLSSLQTLDVFIVSSHGNDECQIGDLRNLNNIRGLLSIKGLDEEGTKGVAEALQLHPNLKSLLKKTGIIFHLPKPCTHLTQTKTTNILLICEVSDYSCMSILLNTPNKILFPNFTNLNSTLTFLRIIHDTFKINCYFFF
ncbi:hypothetical protein AAG906_029718 [Vitis piasezkii]